jgi:hypothetical protein
MADGVICDLPSAAIIEEPKVDYSFEIMLFLL